MTVAAKSPTISYQEDGSTLAFAVPWYFLAPSDLIVQRTDAAGNVTTLVLFTNYTVSGGGAAAGDNGGTVTLVATVAGCTLAIWRATARVQPIDYATNDSFPSATAELGLDRDMLIEQEQDAGISSLEARALQVPPGETVGLVPALATRANLVLGFDPLGQPIAVDPSAGFADLTLRAQLAQPGGSTLVGFSQSGVAPLAATVQSKARMILSAADFIGFDATGVSASTTAIQNALNEAAARGRCDVMIPKGALTGALTIPAGAGLIGPRPRAQLAFVAGNYTGLTVTGSDVAIENLELTGTAKTGGFTIAIACGTATLERLAFTNLLTWDSYGFITDSGSGASGYHITTRIRSCQARRHRGPGVVMTRLFAFSFWNEVVIDYNGSASADFTGFNFNLSGLGAAAGGLTMENCDVGGTTTGANWPNQHGYIISNTAAVWLDKCRADTCGGKGFQFNTVNQLECYALSSGLCNLGNVELTSVTNSLFSDTRVFGRNALTNAAGVDGIKVISGCYDIVFKGALVRDLTGHGVNRVAAQAGPILLTGLVSTANTGRGVKTVGNSATLVAGSQLVSNTLGNYDLGGTFDFIQTTQLSSGAVVNVGPGPITG